MATEEITRYTDQELFEFKAIIESKLQKAEEQFDFYKNQLKELNLKLDL